MDRAAYDRYQARFFDVFKKIQRTVAAVASEGICAAGLKQVSRYHHQGPIPNPKPNGNGAAA